MYDWSKVARHTGCHPLLEGCLSDTGRLIGGSPCRRVHLEDQCPDPEGIQGFPRHWPGVVPLEDADGYPEPPIDVGD